MGQEQKLSSKKQKLLAALKRKRKDETRKHTIPAMERVARQSGARYPMSRGQRQLFLKYLQNPQAKGQNIRKAHRLRGEIKVDLMEAAINDLVAYHELFRTAFQLEKDEAYLTILDQKHLNIERVDARDLDEAAYRDLIVETEEQAFNLQTGESMRVCLFQVEADCYDLLFVQHHIISDLWTLDLLSGQLVAAYNARLDGSVLEFPPHALQFVDYTTWQAGWLTGEVYDEQLNYWVKKLTDLPVLELPMDMTASPAAERKANSHHFELDAAVKNRLQAFCVKHSLSMFMVMVFCYQMALARFSWQRDFGIGTALANRSNDALAKMVGYFVNMVVLRNPMHKERTVVDHLQRWKKVVLKAFNDCNIPLMELVQHLNIYFNPLRPPLFQALFLYQNVSAVRHDGDAGQEGLAFKGLSSEGVGGDTETIAYDMICQIFEGPDFLSCQLICPADVMDNGVLVGMGEAMTLLASQIDQFESRNMWELEVVDAASRREQIRIWQALDHGPWLQTTPGPLATFQTQLRDAAGSDALKPLVLDQSLQLVPSGAYGQLCIAGLEPQRFESDATFETVSVPDQDAQTVLVTGEKARLLADGQIALVDEENHAALSEALAGEPPRDEHEHAAAEIIKDLLKLPGLPSRDANFFQIGGHSLTASRAISRLGQHFGRELGLGLIFQNPTIAGLIEAVNASAEAGLGLAQTRDLRTGVANLPLSYNQERFWRLQKAIGPTHLYVIPFIVEFRGPLQIEHIETALLNMVDRHEVLRTRFVERDGGTWQQIDGAPQQILHVVDLEPFGEEVAEDLLHPMLEADISRPFDFTTGPVIRTTLYKMAPARSVLAVCIHHVAFDGSSRAILLKEIGVAYAQLCEGLQPVMDVLPAQYGDFTLWQRQRLEGPVGERLLDFWTEYLKDVPEVLPLPSDRERPAKASLQAKQYRFQIPKECSRMVMARASEHGLTQFMMYESLLALLFSKLSGISDICIGSPVSGRTHADYHPLIGFFINNVVIRSNPAAALTVGQYWQQTRERVLSAFEHEEMPIDLLVDKLVTRKRQDVAPLFQVMFVLQNFDHGDEYASRIKELEIKEFDDFHYMLARYDLSVVIRSVKEGDLCEITYAADLFDKERIAGFASSFIELAQQVLAGESQTPLQAYLG